MFLKNCWYVAAWDHELIDGKMLARTLLEEAVLLYKSESGKVVALQARIAGAIRTALSPRFVPDAIVQVAEVPRTLSGKKQELPIKKLLLGQPIEKVVNRDAMANPQCLDWYVDFAGRRTQDHQTLGDRRCS